MNIEEYVGKTHRKKPATPYYTTLSYCNAFRKCTVVSLLFPRCSMLNKLTITSNDCRK